MIYLFYHSYPIYSYNFIAFLCTILSYTGALLAFIGGIPVVGLIVKIVGTLVWIYEIVGIVLAILTFIK
ncbi:MAG: hypothetical protein IJD58_03290 [Lachnospiraceae bacterium]|nr:hypothetical protein [Lachnospiraceae bacterium]